MRRALLIAGWVLLATMVVHIVALVVTGGAVTGPVSLRKPATFAETGWLTAWSVALILPRLRLRAWQRGVVGTTVLLFGIGETTVMAIQAWRGVPSHYNFTTAFDAALVRGGAAGLAVLFLIGLVVLLVAAFRTHDAEPSVLLGIRSSIVVLLIGCVIGFVMISNMSGVFQGSIGSAFTHPQFGYVGPPPSVVGRDVLLVHVHTQGGDLVSLHAIGVHGLPLLAVPAILLTRTRLAERIRLRLVATMAAGVGLAMLVIATQSFRSQPLASMDLVHRLLLALTGIALAVVYALTVLALIRRWGGGAARVEHAVDE